MDRLALDQAGRAAVPAIEFQGALRSEEMRMPELASRQIGEQPARFFRRKILRDIAGGVAMDERQMRLTPQIDPAHENIPQSRVRSAIAAQGELGEGAVAQGIFEAGEPFFFCGRLRHHGEAFRTTAGLASVLVPGAERHPPCPSIWICSRLVARFRQGGGGWARLSTKDLSSV